MPDELALPPLEKGLWASTPQSDASLDDVLKAVTSADSVAGIAYTTAGARAITSVSDGTLHSTDGDVDRTTVYELRLWQTAITDTSEVLAHEWRWVNGSGAAEITVWKTSNASGKGDSCWYRPNAYLQHGAKLPEDPKTMTSIEVFTEQEYGNTVFVDEFMTGKWG